MHHLPCGILKIENADARARVYNLKKRMTRQLNSLNVSRTEKMSPFPVLTTHGVKIACLPMMMFDAEGTKYEYNYN